MRPFRTTLVAIALALIAPCAVSPAAEAQTSCTSTLSAGGNVQTFADSLSAGQVGCLRQGDYSFSALRINRAGITLQSYPGERATLKGGYIYVPPGSDDVTFDTVNIDTGGFDGVGVQLYAHGARLLNSDVTNRHLGESCITLSNYGGKNPTIARVVVQGNRIHGCGQASNGSHDHGIYVANATGPVVSDNTFEDNCCGWGIQLWTTSINGVYERNVIRAAPGTSEGGVIIVAGNGTTGNVFRNNTLVSNGRPYVVDEYQAAQGAKFYENCIVPNGAPLFESAWFDGGTNRPVLSEADCGTAPPPPPPPPPGDVDGDGDGVVDGSDLCPGTPAGTAVDATGCPLPPPPPPPPSSGPSVTITEPADGSTTTASAVCGRVTATDDKGIAKVVWVLDGRVQQTERTYTVAPYNYTCWGITVGTHTIKATATDTDGNTASDTNTWTRR